MIRKFIPLFFTWVLSISWVAAQVVDCPALVEAALSRVQNACAAMGGNQACYGYHTLDAQLTPGLSEFAFNGVGDITPVDTIQSLRLSALNPANDEWGVAVMRIRADIPEAQADDNVTLIAFGGVTLDADTSGSYQPMQAFTLSTEDTSSGCTNVTENGLLIQTPEGVGKVTLWINEVKIRIGSTVLFQAQPGGDLMVSTFEGSAEVEVMGQMQEAVAGTSVLVPLDSGLHPAAPPTLPQVFDGDATGLIDMMNVTTSFTDRTVTDLLPPANSAVDDTAPDGVTLVDDVIGSDGSQAAEATAAAPSENPSAEATVGSTTDDPGSGDAETPAPPGGDGGQSDPGDGGDSSGGGGGLLGDLLDCVFRLCILR